MARAGSLLLVATLALLASSVVHAQDLATAPSELPGDAPTLELPEAEAPPAVYAPGASTHRVQVDVEGTGARPYPSLYLWRPTGWALVCATIPCHRTSVTGAFTLGLGVGGDAPVAVEGLFALATDVRLLVEHADREGTRLASLAPFALGAVAIGASAALFFSAGGAGPNDAFVAVTLGIVALAIAIAMMVVGTVLVTSRDVRRVVVVERPARRTPVAAPLVPPQAATYAVPR